MKTIMRLPAGIDEIMAKYQANPKDHPWAGLNHAFFWAVVKPQGRQSKPQRVLITHSGPWTDLEAMRNEISKLSEVISVSYRLD